MSLRQAGSRSFTAATALLKAKASKDKATSAPTTDVVAPTEAAIKLTTGLMNMRKMDYTRFMKKIQKLNPDIQFTKSTADKTLERSLALLHPSGVMKAVTNSFGNQKASAQRLDSGQRQLVNDWKRLLKESEEYWGADGSSGKGSRFLVVAQDLAYSRDSNPILEIGRGFIGAP